MWLYTAVCSVAYRGKRTGGGCVSLCVCVQYTGWGRVALAAIVWVACMCGGRGYTVH